MGRSMGRLRCRLVVKLRAARSEAKPAEHEGPRTVVERKSREQEQKIEGHVYKVCEHGKEKQEEEMKGAFILYRAMVVYRMQEHRWTWRSSEVLIACIFCT